MAGSRKEHLELSLGPQCWAGRLDSTDEECKPKQIKSGKQVALMFGETRWGIDFDGWY